MKEKERYVVERISIGYRFPKALCGLKDTESKFYVVFENIYAVIMIKDLLNQQDKEIKELKEKLSYEISSHELCISDFRIECEKLRKQIKFEHDARERFKQDNCRLKQSQKQLAISALEEVNSILTNIIIDVTEYEMNLDKLCYFEEISYKFGQAIKNKVKGLKK